MDRSRKRPADTQEAAWVAGEDKFVLQQAKKKAAIRVKEGRAKPIDWLAVTLRFVDPARNPFDDEIEDSELDVVDPEGVLEGLSEAQLEELEKDINVYATLETNKTNREFWDTMEIICNERRQKLFGSGQRTGRSQDSVSAEVNKLFGAKTYEELESLERQIRTKLTSKEPIDFEYWENLLHSLVSWKARAKLKHVSQSIVESQLKGLRKQQEEEAIQVKDKIGRLVFDRVGANGEQIEADRIQSVPELDPEPMLKIRSEDKSLQIKDEKRLLDEIRLERQKITKLGYVPSSSKKTEVGEGMLKSHREQEHHSSQARVSRTHNDEFSRATTALYEREVARGVGENEEIFTNEEEVTSGVKPQWSNKYRPRKPRYFNRVQMGYEWNKYNQTHYDHDNPPPKVVQGYKFNIFYPDLIDKTKAPTYKIERENGRKRGQSFAPAGQEDTCLIRFVAGPPYEDIAFRIVDKEWDYSAKRERGFRSSFDKGILQLHFQFKRIFYRK